MLFPLFVYVAWVFTIFTILPFTVGMKLTAGGQQLRRWYVLPFIVGISCEAKKEKNGKEVSAKRPLNSMVFLISHYFLKKLSIFPNFFVLNTK